MNMKTKSVKVVEMFPSASTKAKTTTAVVMADLQKQAKPLFSSLKKITTIATAEDFDAAGIQAKKLKQLLAIARNNRDEIVKPMRDGVNKSIEKIDEHFKPFFEQVTKIETDIKLLMSVYLEESKNKRSKLDEDFTNTNMKISTYSKKLGDLMVTSSKGGAQIRKVWTAVLLDKDKVPRKYLVPDMVSIEQDLKAGKKVPGFSWEQVEQIAI